MELGWEEFGWYSACLGNLANACLREKWRVEATGKEGGQSQDLGPLSMATARSEWETVLSLLDSTTLTSGRDRLAENPQPLY